MSDIAATELLTGDEVLVHIYRAATLKWWRDDWKGRGRNEPGTLQPIAGAPSIEVPNEILQELSAGGFIAQISSNPMGNGYGWWQLTDEGLRRIGRPTKAEMSKLEVVGVDNRKVRKARGR